MRGVGEAVKITGVMWENKIYIPFISIYKRHTKREREKEEIEKKRERAREVGGE